MKNAFWILVYVISAVLSCRSLAAVENRYVTSFVGEDISLIFPAPSLGDGMTMFRDFRWAIEIVAVKCDGVEISSRDVGPMGEVPCVVNEVPDGQVIYSTPSDDLSVYTEMNGELHLLEYKIPAFPNRIEIEYRVRRPNRAPSTDTNIVTTFIRPLFPVGKKAPQDRR